MARRKSPTPTTRASRPKKAVRPATEHKGRKPRAKKVSKATEPALPTAPAIDLQKLKVAIVCDWLTGTGGAERVVLELHRLFPKAPIYTSQYDKDPKIWYGGDWFKNADVRTTRLQHLPKRLKKFLPVLRAREFSRLDLSGYDLVITSAGAEAKAVKTGPDTKLVWYCHAPTHYYWSRYEEYLKHPGFGAFDPLARAGLFSLVRPLRKWDHAAAQRPDLVIANSSHIQSEIKKYYGRESVVVFPPVDTHRFQAADGTDRSDGRGRFGFVCAGRQTPYKRIDLAVEACSRLRLPLTVIGNGPEHTRLTAMAGPSVRFLTNVSDKEFAHHFNLAQAFIFPGIDDFGIVAVEALSAGTPVIAYKAGGALDYIRPGATGEFFDEQTADSLMKTLRAFRSEQYDSKAIVQHAETYSVSRFADNMTHVVQDFLAK
ncbi:MAG TPA: glycosyltransferase [Candidatus Saccharimonadales bacterium]|jgi:glycosyltransferase involved in cell wall biosynthesis